ncbi:MAG: extracellular solute-binding protein [Deltaproteobacteria bacterium]|nr:extracellular solute-binding protein [Deltaproteobacteria bacterium]
MRGKRQREVTRREFLKVAGGVGLAISSATLLGPSFRGLAWGAQGATAEERAINAARALKAKMKGDTLTVMVPSGGEGSFITSKPWWEEATGIKLNIIVVPMAEIVNKCMNVAVTKSKEFDVMLPSPFGLPDLVEAKLAMDLTDFVKEYNPELTGPNGVIPPMYLFGMYKGRLYGFVTDGDVNSLIIRRDWLEDENNQKAFADKYGYPLRPPVLYSELFDQMEFFTNREKQIYGAWIFTSPFYTKWEWMNLSIAKGLLPFDKDVHPQLTKEASLRTLEELIKINPYLHPGCSTGGWSEQYKAYAEGNIWCAFSWPSFIKYMNMPDFSKVCGKIMVCKVPGYKLASGMVLRPCRFTFSWIYIVSNYSRNPEIAYLYSQWMYSPTISTKIIPVKGGYFDVYRYNHMKNEGLLKLYDPHVDELREALIFNIENSYPELEMKGGDEYMTRLDENVIAALKGLKKPEAAMKETSEMWEEITERYGRDKQREQWNFLTSCYGASLRKAMGLPEPPAWLEEIG